MRRREWKDGELLYIDPEGTLRKVWPGMSYHEPWNAYPVQSWLLAEDWELTDRLADAVGAPEVPQAESGGGGQ